MYAARSPVTKRSGVTTDAPKDNKKLGQSRPAKHGLRADGRPRKRPRPYAGESTLPPDPSAADEVQAASRARSSAGVFMETEVRASRVVKAETEHGRSVRLLADDRADHRVPSIRREVITGGLDADGEAITLRAPSVEDGSWRDPDDTVPNASRVPRRVRANRRANNLRWMQKRGVALSDDHVTAGELYEQDYETAHIGRFPGAPPPEIRGTPGPGDYSRCIDKSRMFNEAEAAVGHFGADLLRHVVLGREGSAPGDISSWAATKQVGGRQLDRKAAVGVLIATLEILVGHYGRRIRDKQKSEA